MSKIKDCKTFKDSIHGYVNVPNYFVKNLIDTEYFQRLRNIDQTGMKIVYPCAKHDRFSHSIGVFHLGQKAVESLLDSIYVNGNHNKDFPSNLKELERNRILFLIACLLHDIGHTPFSHSLEGYVLEKSSIINGEEKAINIYESLKQKIITYEKNSRFGKEKDDALLENNIKKSAAHEQMGAHLIFENELQSKIKKIFEELNEIGYVDMKNHIIQFEEGMDGEVSQNIFNDNLCFIARMIMGIKYENYDKNRQIRNCFIELLNGENFDVDKLDYIIRDTQMSGISNIDVDVERLLKSICINISTKHFNKDNLDDKKLKDKIILNIKNNHKEDVLHINGEFKGTILIKKGTRVIISENSFFALLKGKISFEGENIGKFDEQTNVLVDSVSLPSVAQEDGCRSKIIKGNDTGEISTYFIENAKTEKDFRFKVEDDIEFVMHKQCNMKIKGIFQSKSSISVFSVDSLKGKICEIEILGDTFQGEYTERKQPSAEGFNAYHIGFKKQAINVIANVLKARNFLYLWIYAHHKVVYYANFLIPIIAKELFSKGLDEDKFPGWDLCYKNIKYLDDCYIWTLIRHVLYLNEKSIDYNDISDELKELMQEAVNRKYKSSLYKSLVEYDLFFDSFSESDRVKLIKKISGLIDESKPYIKNANTPLYDIGYFKADEIEKINGKINEIERIKGETNNIKITQLIFVVANYKIKQLHASNVYINMGNENYVPISKMPLLDMDSENEQSRNNKSYFYLYYETNEGKLLTNQVDILKKAIKNYLKNYIKERENV